MAFAAPKDSGPQIESVAIRPTTNGHMDAGPSDGGGASGSATAAMQKSFAIAVNTAPHALPSTEIDDMPAKGNPRVWVRNKNAANRL